MTGIISTLSGLMDLIVGALTWIIDGIKFVIISVPYLIWDGLLTTIHGIFNGLDIGSHLVSISGQFGLLPAQMQYVLFQTGVPSSISILLWASVIRMLINLIPSWATRF